MAQRPLPSITQATWTGTRERSNSGGTGSGVSGRRRCRAPVLILVRPDTSRVADGWGHRMNLRDLPLRDSRPGTSIRVAYGVSRPGGAGGGSEEEPCPSQQLHHARHDDMFAVHGVFRDTLGAAPTLVGGIAPGDAERVALIANYYENILSFLESHHDGEEELVFPLLRALPATAR